MPMKSTYSKLLEALIGKGVVTKTTLFTASFKTRGLGGKGTAKIIDEFSLRDIIYEHGKTYFVGERTNLSAEVYKIPVAAITLIDGMDIPKLGTIYQLKADGTPKIEKLCPITGEPLRRGRKPNWVKAKMAAMSIEDNSDAPTGS